MAFLRTGGWSQSATLRAARQVDSRVSQLESAEVTIAARRDSRPREGEQPDGRDGGQDYDGASHSGNTVAAEALGDGVERGRRLDSGLVGEAYRPGGRRGEVSGNVRQGESGLDSDEEPDAQSEERHTPHEVGDCPTPVEADEGRCPLPASMPAVPSAAVDRGPTCR